MSPAASSRVARSGRPIIQEWARTKAERGELDQVVWIVAALEEIIQDVLEGKHQLPGVEPEAARTYLRRQIEELRAQAKISLGQ